MDGRDASASGRPEETRTDGPDAGSSAGAMHAVTGRQAGQGRAGARSHSGGEWRKRRTGGGAKKIPGDTVRAGRGDRQAMQSYGRAPAGVGGD